MKFVIHPAVGRERLDALRAAVPGAEWVNAADEEDGAAAMPGADAFLGKITPTLLPASLSPPVGPGIHGQPGALHLPRLVDHPCVLTNVRGLFGDVIADQVIGLHSLLRRTSTRTSAARSSTATNRSAASRRG